MADGRKRGDRWAEYSGLLDAARSGSLGRVVALLRVGEASNGDRELVRQIEAVARLVVLSGASVERLDEVRGMFSRPGRVRVETDEHVAIQVARSALGAGDVLLAVSSRAGLLWEVMRTPLGSVRRSA